jgi:hypothetical protein
MSEDIHYRDATADDVGFILASWLKSAGDAWATMKHSDVSEWCKHKQLAGVQVGWFADVPHRFTRSAVVEVIERPATRVVVACDVEDPTLLFGFAVTEPANRIVHWVHVKHALRRNGVAKELMTRSLPTWREGVDCTYVGRGFLGWMSKYPLRFRPHAGR